jgi:hypothetical protein
MTDLRKLFASDDVQRRLRDFMVGAAERGLVRVDPNDSEFVKFAEIIGVQPTAEFRRHLASSIELCLLTVATPQARPGQPEARVEAMAKQAREREKQLAILQAKLKSLEEGSELAYIGLRGDVCDLSGLDFDEFDNHRGLGDAAMLQLGDRF